LSAGAFSDDAVVKTSAEKVVPILVDCTKPGQNKELQEKYKVEGYPTLIFVDPATEKQVAEHYPSDAKSFVAEIEKQAADHARKK
jgi:thioredoxin-related protein